MVKGRVMIKWCLSEDQGEGAGLPEARVDDNVCSGTVQILDLLTRLMQKPETLPHQKESLVENLS